MKVGWQRKRLGELAELRGRIGWRGLTAKEYTKSGPLLLSVHSLNYGDYVDFRDAFHISEARYQESPEIMVREGDVLICKDGAGIGKVGIVGAVPDKTTINSSLLLIRSGREILPKFLYRCLSSPYFQNIVQSRLSGATTPHLYQRDITEFPVLLPPLPEQRRISAFLDEAFGALEIVSANTEKNRLNAAALYESELDAALTFPEGETSVPTTLGHEVEVQVGFAFKSAEFTEAPDDIRLLRGDNIVPGRFRWDGVKRYPAKRANEYQQFALAEDDIVLAMDRPWVSAGLKRAQIGADDLPCLLVQRTARIRARAGLDNRFLYHLTGCRQFTAHLVGNQTGLGVPHISGQQIKDFQFRKPDIGEQRRIASTLDSLWSETGRVSELFSRKCQAIRELRDSVLNEAFGGHL